MEFIDLYPDIILLILSMDNHILISSQSISKYIRQITKNKFVFQIPITSYEINNYIEQLPNRFKINYGGNHVDYNYNISNFMYNYRTSYYWTDIYMIDENDIVINNFFCGRSDLVGQGHLMITKFDFDALIQFCRSTGYPEVKCEIDFISQCKILTARFNYYDCKLLKMKIFELLHNIVSNFKTCNDISYSYLIHDLSIFNIKDDNLKNIEFIMQNTDLIVDYLYEKISGSIKIEK